MFRQVSYTSMRYFGIFWDLNQNRVWHWSIFGKIRHLFFIFCQNFGFSNNFAMKEFFVESYMKIILWNVHFALSRYVPSCFSKFLFFIVENRIFSWSIGLKETAWPLYFMISSSNGDTEIVSFLPEVKILVSDWRK